MENSKILIRNAAQIVTCHGDKARRGAEMSDLGVIEDGAVAMSDGVITHVGPTEEVLRNIHAEDYLEIRAENQAVLPGFVDSHTHLSLAVTGRRSSLGDCGEIVICRSWSVVEVS